jgi:hypothetical protein
MAAVPSQESLSRAIFESISDPSWSFVATKRDVSIFSKASLEEGPAGSVPGEGGEGGGGSKVQMVKAVTVVNGSVPAPQQEGRSL